MQRILAIASLTWKAAFRYRLFWVLAVLLLASVVGFPLLLKDDGTARGLTQILLTYTLSAMTGLLGFATLWVSCGTLAHDVEECQMQVVTVKPIARWQIWIGKWLGIMTLNAALVLLSGVGVYGLLQYRAQSLPEDQRAILKKEIFVARASAKEAPVDISRAVDGMLKAEVKKRVDDGKEPNETALRKQIEFSIRAQRMAVPPGYYKRFVVNVGPNADRLRGKQLQARFKFQSGDPNARDGAVYTTLWQVGPPGSGKLTRLPAGQAPADSFQEIDIPADLCDNDGKLTVDFVNANETVLLFGDQDGFEVLYPEGSFELNFLRGMGIILCWLSLLATIGLAASSWLSFPVAAFVSLTVLLMGSCSSLLSSAIEQNSIFGYEHESNKPIRPEVDRVVIPFFKGALTVINLVKDFSPIDSLSSGRSITWADLGLAVAQIILLMGGLLAALGIVLFNRRELAAVQGSS